MTNPAVSLPGHRKESRTRLTRNDRVVLSCLEKQGEPMKAYELLERLRHEGINAPMTVYRALGRLANQGLVRKMESINAYFATPPDRGDTLPAFLVCQRCGAVGFKSLQLSKLAEVAPDLEVLDASIELKTDCFTNAQTRPLSGQCPNNDAD